MTGSQQNLPDPKTMNDQDLKGTALHVLNVFLSGRFQLEGQQDEAGNLTVYAVGVSSLDDLPAEVWEQLVAQGISYTQVQLSDDSVFGNAVLDEARTRFGEAFATIEAAMRDANAKIAEVSASVNALIEDFVGRPDPQGEGGCGGDCGTCEGGGCGGDCSGCEGGCGCKG